MPTALLKLVVVLVGHAAVGVADTWNLMLDCGSSGTRMHIYHWQNDSDILEFEPANKSDAKLLKVQPGLSAYINHTSGVKGSLQPLLDQALRWIPAASVAETRIRAFATAGMRLYAASEQESVWAAVNDLFSSSPFLFTPGQDAYTISGNYEGLFNYMSTQYILGKAADKGANQHVGGLDMGGASTQVTFSPPDGVILQDAYRIAQPSGPTNRVYSHSYMRSGLDQALLRYAQRLADASKATSGSVLTSFCHNVGYSYNASGLQCGDKGARTPCTVEIVGKGDFAKCQKVVMALLNLENECLLGPCAADGVYQPSPSNVSLYAVSGYWYMVRGLGLTPADATQWVGTVPRIQGAAEHFCQLPYMDIEKDPYAKDYCFNSAYMTQLLTAISVQDTDSVTFVDSLGGYSMGWALGAQLYYVARDNYANGVGIPVLFEAL